MVQDSRERIFAAIRRGLRGSAKSVGQLNAPHSKGSTGDLMSLFAKFSSELRLLGGEALLFDDEENISRFIMNNAGERVFVFRDLAPKHFIRTLGNIRNFKTDEDFAVHYEKREAAVFDSVISPCLVCIAETGTIVMSNNMRLPPAFSMKLFVIAEMDKLISSLDELFTDEYKNFTGSNLFLISGPSRTADIEKQLVTGVHGPKEVYVIFIKK
jgi:L-lactate utilization protein LutC